VPSVDPQRALLLLLRLTQELTLDKPLEHALQSVTDAIKVLLPADHVSIRLLDQKRDALLSGARTGTGVGNRPMEFRRGEGVIGWVVEHAESVRIGRVAADPRFVRPDDQKFPIQSMMCEPLFSGGEVIGVLAVTSPHEEAFGEDDQLLLRLLGNCSSPPIERARLKRLAMFDDLTGAFNHRYLSPRLQEELERAGRTANGEVSLLLLDLDHFKNVNDVHGHKAGDNALKHFADRVRASTRRIDILVRRGGEEFVLIMPQTGITQAHSTASRIQEKLDKEMIEVLPGVHIRQTVSIGVATWDGRESPEALEARADKAMYEGKRQGRNRVIIAP
jgi:two-component system cell cycle response regulator